MDDNIQVRLEELKLNIDDLFDSEEGRDALSELAVYIDTNLNRGVK